jgi:hypothetical protein
MQALKIEETRLLAHYWPIEVDDLEPPICSVVLDQLRSSQAMPVAAVLTFALPMYPVPILYPLLMYLLPMCLLPIFLSPTCLLPIWVLPISLLPIFSVPMFLVWMFFVLKFVPQVPLPMSVPEYSELQLTFTFALFLVR